jgi:Bacterial pre-peptidase C-terminal domain/CARDB
LTVGSGSTLTVTGAYAQGSAAGLTFVLGGTPASGQFGRLTINGSASLAGSMTVSFLNGFSPTAGSDYAVVTFSSETGGSALSFSGLSSGRFAFLKPVVAAQSITLDTTTSASDLATQPFNAPSTGTAGGPLNLTYQVKNLSSTAAAGSWLDWFYLSTNQTLDSGDVLVDRLEHSGGVAANSEYTETLSSTLPAVAPGNYFIIDVADSQELVPDVDRANNVAVSSTAISISVRPVSLGGSTSGTVATDQNVVYKLNLPAGHNVQISLTTGVAGAASLYERYLSPPTLSDFDQAATSASQSTQTITVNNTPAGVYYLVIQGSGRAGTGTDYSLSVVDLAFGITSVSPASGSTAPAGTADLVTVTIKGSQFTPSTTVSLVDPGGTAHPATQTTFADSDTLFATLDLGSVSAGAAEIRVQQGSQSAQSGFHVQSGSSGSSFSPGHLSVSLAAPSVVRPPFRNSTVTVTYTNDGGTDIPAPLLQISSSNGEFQVPGETGFTPDALMFLGINSQGPAGILPPGASGTITVDFQPISVVAHGVSDVNVAVADSSATIDWSAVKSGFEPPDFPGAAWDAVFANFTAAVGSTLASLQAALDSDATYLSEIGTYTPDVARLLYFQLDQAGDFGAIALRNTPGVFGLGIPDPTVSAVTDAQGDVQIVSGSTVRPFMLQSDGSYQGAAGDFGILSENSGIYQLRESDGTVEVFNSNGSLNFSEDTNGNKTIYGYTGTQLTTITNTLTGDVTTFSYNAQGRAL